MNFFAIVTSFLRGKPPNYDLTNFLIQIITFSDENQNVYHFTFGHPVPLCQFRKLVLLFLCDIPDNFTRRQWLSAWFSSLRPFARVGSWACDRVASVSVGSHREDGAGFFHLPR